MGAFGNPVDTVFNLDFATPKLKEVVSASTKGQNQKSGLEVKAAFRM